MWLTVGLGIIAAGVGGLVIRALLLKQSAKRRGDMRDHIRRLNEW